MKNRWSVILRSRQLCILILLLAGVLLSNAQENSPSYSDTTTANDTVAISPESETRTDSDTTQNFFTWKVDINQPYSQNKIGSRVPADTEISKLKQEDDFWYIRSIEKFKSSPEAVIYDKAKRDSIAKRRKADVDTHQFSGEDRYNFNLPPWLGTLMWGVIIAVFLFAVVYFLLANKISIFSRSSADKTTTEAVGEEVDWDPLESTCRHASLSIL